METSPAVTVPSLPGASPPSRMQRCVPCVQSLATNAIGGQDLTTLVFGVALALLSTVAPAPANALSPQPLPPGGTPTSRTASGGTIAASSKPIVDVLGVGNSRVAARATRLPRTDPKQMRSDYPLSASAQKLMMAARPPSAGNTESGLRVTGHSIGNATGSRPGLNAMKTCAEARLGPEISRITALSPGRAFTIDGICFGDRIGRAYLTGGPGAGTTLSFSKWTDTQIVGQVGKASGVRDGNVEITLATSDGQRAVPRMAHFIAERATVRVPPERWAPGGSLRWAVTDYPGIAKLKAQFPDVALQPGFQLPQRFSARLTEGCEVVAAGIEGTGFETSRPMQFEATATAHDATLSIGLHPATTARIRDELHSPIGATGVPVPYTVSRGSLTLSAEAICPVGVAP